MMPNRARDRLRTAKNRQFEKFEQFTRWEMNQSKVSDDEVVLNSEEDVFIKQEQSEDSGLDQFDVVELKPSKHSIQNMMQRPQSAVNKIVINDRTRALRPFSAQNFTNYAKTGSD